MAARKKSSRASSARTSGDGAARTIIYVHGIGNKPEPHVLKCQWDMALFGFDLGERSRLAYWVNRAYYPEPSSGTCATGDLVTTGELSGPPALGARALTAEEPVEDFVAGITKDKAARQTLLAIAQRLDREPTAAAEKTLHAHEVDAKISPFPKPVRRWLTRRLTGALLRDVNDLFYVQERREAMRNSLKERILAGGGPFVIIGHSQGSMIAYDVLCEMSRKRPAPDVALFVTVGSPLGIKEVQDQLEQLTKQKRLAVPSCVRGWLNVADPLDPLAFDKRLKSDFAAHKRVAIDDNLEWNPDSPRHPHSGSGYLRTKPVQRAVKSATDTALFQPVAPFVIAREVVRQLESSSNEFRHKVLIELSDPTESGAASLDNARRNVVLQIIELSGRKEDDEDLCIEPLQR
ncbi:MAG: serine peptidase, partial [Woeseiaceae bacterium]